MNIKETLKLLCEPVGVAGNEFAASEAALKLLLQFMPNAEIDKFGTVVGILETDEKLPLLLLDAHIDEVGMIVNFIDEKGFVKVGRVGGIDRRALPAAQVTIHGKKPVKGVVCALPPHVQKDENKVLKEEEIAIDCGYSKNELEELISLGDSITIDARFTELQNGKINARALDDRAGVCAILYALNLLKNKKLKYNLAVTFSSQEEIGLRGAAISAYNINPDLAIAVDVSYGNYPGSTENETWKLGEGVMLGIAPTLDRNLFERMKNIAINKKIKHQIEVMNSKTSTNADIIGMSRKGVRCALLSIPLRNMHTPAETLQLSDIEATGQLIAEFMRGEIDD
ncbi:MAG: M20/M25/M40 family metallo-hydrolase [Oscillospiraceae bacterium]|jgi:endoglucanase|nr:M20/M25/M40 family metallo-hydrolase [Oscillospiraceae bacterium]